MNSDVSQCSVGVATSNHGREEARAGAATRGDRAAGSDAPARWPDEGGFSSVFAVLAHTAGRFDGIDRARVLVVGALGLTGSAAIAAPPSP